MKGTYGDKCSPGHDPCYCTKHDSAWSLNLTRCQKALGLPEPKERNPRRVGVHLRAMRHKPRG